MKARNAAVLGIPNEAAFVTNDSFLRLAEVLTVIRISKSSWYLGIQQGLYPPPLRLGKRTSVWRRSQIEQLIAQVGQS